MDLITSISSLLITREPLLPRVTTTNSHREERSPWQFANLSFLKRLKTSDSFCVDRHRESFLELINKYIDIVFCNESEVLSLFKKDKLAKCQGDLSSLCELVVVTLGSNGSLIINKNEVKEIKSISKGKIIDTTGAGDIYAGGFIHGLINNYSLKKCGEIGSICAGQIITQLGSRSEIDLKELIK